MLSGVGDSSDLASVGIQTVLDAPEVGKNLQDHIIAMVPFNASEDLTKDAFTLVSPVTVLDYFTVGKGPLSSNGGAVGNAFVHTKVKF